MVPADNTLTPVAFNRQRESPLFFVSSHPLKYLSGILSLLCLSGFLKAQEQKPYDRKEEVIFDGKRYRVYNNWLSAGGGWAWNSYRKKDQKSVAADYNFHIRRQYFQVGAFMTGNNFTPGNNYNFHLGIGLRKETTKYNLAAFAGPSLSYYYRPLKDTLNYDISKLYNDFGAYMAVQAIYKIKYDVGIGAELFADYNRTQFIPGGRIVLYFSGAFRGVRRGNRGTEIK